MKSNACVALFLGWLTVVAFTSVAAGAVADRSVQAAERGAGSLSGRVKNAVTGQYLGKARLVIKGTGQVTYTDDFGTYRFPRVASGPIVLEVFYTDLDAQEIALTIADGTNIERNIDLTSRTRYGQEGSVVALDPFLVAMNRETDAEALATSEQRFAPNLKNVIATDALGDVFGSNAGDFLKFLPGLAAEYDNAEVSGISVRGIGTDLTSIVVDGAPIVSGNQVGPSRKVDMRTLALNNLSRVEVTKVPTPSSPADTLGGTVNMVSKSAFERSGAEFRYGLNLTGNGNAVTLRRTPHGYLDEETYKLLPGFDFDYTLPIGKRFGVVVTGMESNKFNTQDLSTTSWSAAGTATGASIGNPFFQTFVSRAFPRHTVRAVYSVKADWRVTPNSVLSFGGRWSRNVSARSGGYRLTANVGTNGTPTSAAGVPLTFSSDFTNGATGRGAVSLLGEWQYAKVIGYGGDLNYRFDNGRWKVESGLNVSAAQPVLNPRRGPVYFNNVTAVLRTPVRVVFGGIGPDGPRTIQAFDNSNREVDLRNPDNYVLSSATQQIRKQRTAVRSGRIDVRHRLDLWAFPTAVQFGGFLRTQVLDTRWESPSLAAAPNIGAGSYLYDVFVGETLPGGFRNVPGLDPGKVSVAYLASPALFPQTSAQVVAAETARLGASEYAEESVSALYLQGELRLLNSRLNLLTGVRFERTDVSGQGLRNDPAAVFVRNPDGTFARNAQGARIRRPEAGAAGSLEDLRLTRTERGYMAERSYDGYYPSLHLTYDILENFITRLAYARTYGRPNFPDIIPNAVINEADLDSDQLGNPAFVQGSITIRNTGLKPWTAHNYDLSLEYYTPSGGMLTAGVFLKEITNFFGTGVRIATTADLEELGLDPKYVGWNLSTKFNSGDARVSGVELNVRQSLRQLGSWGRHFTFFANATRLKLEGNPYASFTSFVPKTANWGFSFNWQRLSVIPRWNYRGQDKLVAVPAFGPDAFRYVKSRTILDLNVSYRLSARFSVTGSVSNALNDRLTTLVYGSQTPGHARQALVGDYGAAFSVGIKGSF